MCFLDYVRGVPAAIISQLLFLPLLKQEASPRMAPLMHNLSFSNQKKHPTQCNDNYLPCLWCFSFTPHRRGVHELSGVDYG